MKHPTEETLNEYIDHALPPAIQAELQEHLTTCMECAAHLSVLENLFVNLTALPEEPLRRDLAAPVIQALSTPVSLPPLLQRATLLQIILVITTIIAASPTLMQDLPPFDIEIPALSSQADTLQALWIELLNTQFTLQVPELPAFSIVETTTLALTLVLASALLLWLVGNGLLLKEQNPPSRRNP